jgi:hypothetical protein
MFLLSFLLWYIIYLGNWYSLYIGHENSSVNLKEACYWREIVEPGNLLAHFDWIRERKDFSFAYFLWDVSPCLHFFIVKELYYWVLKLQLSLLYYAYIFFVHTHIFGRCRKYKEDIGIYIYMYIIYSNIIDTI